MSGSLAHSPADILRNLIIDLGDGSTPSDDSAWPVYVGQEPNSPDSLITCYDTAGEIQGKTHIDGEVQERYGVQIRVRDASFPNGQKKAREIAVALDVVALNAVVVSDVVGTGDDTYLVYAVTRRSGPLSLGKATPTSKMNLFTINVVVALRQTT
ncbi:hypothetical protein LCGC14_0909060 [marine sediment metagenome]|uniref:Uncharacterized protein n=1 Tax=marine sediment metagenome TaxID=412755 RepID=A0A0F9NU67_9ZZZZ